MGFIKHCSPVPGTGRGIVAGVAIALMVASVGATADRESGQASGVMGIRAGWVGPEGPPTGSVVGVGTTADRGSGQALGPIRSPAPKVAPEGAPTEGAGAKFTSANEQGRYRYLVKFTEPGLLERRRAGRMTGAGFVVGTPDVQAARSALVARQVNHRQAMSSTLGRGLSVSHHYLVSHSGMAVWLSSAEAERIASLPNVASVERERAYELTTDRGPWFIGADTLWDGSEAPDGAELRGEGMVIASLDTGIDPAHPSFQNDASCGHGDTRPDKVLSALDCSSTDTQGFCNGPEPVDAQGHGSHTASTAGGNHLPASALPLPDPISGVAPCAHIRAYKVCPGSTCPGADIQAGMDSVLIHGDVDVMNFSISGGWDPWNDNDRRKLDLVSAGILVAASAGNVSSNFPQPISNVNHLGPWVLNVAASTDNSEAPGLLSAAGPGEPPADTRDIGARQGSHSPNASALTGFPIRHFGGQDPSAEGCTAGEDGAPAELAPFPAGFFDGAAALIQRGTCPFATKIANAFDAGAEFVVIRNNVAEPFGMVTEGQPEVPAYSIEFAPGQALQDFVSANPDTATIAFEPVLGDVLADFSLRGPTPAPLQNLTKPDVTAPGVNIVAAVPGPALATASGTSMSSPHAAGAATLVRQAHPDWTPSEVMSALVTTADRTGRKDGIVASMAEPWDPDDVGGGRVDLTRAARAGLVMNEVFANYIAADPATGGDVRTLNTPQLRDMNCTPACTWTRRVTNTLDQPVTWTAAGVADELLINVSPAEFDFSGVPGETVELSISASPLGDQTAEVTFGEVVLAPVGGQAPEQHLTVAVRGEGNAAVDVHPAGFEPLLSGGDSAEEALTVRNLGTAVLDWTLGFSGTGADCEAAAPSWLAAAPTSGSIAPGGAPEEVSLNFDAAGLAEGDHEALLCIESNDPGSPQVNVPVTLTVLGDVPAAAVAPASLDFQVPVGGGDGTFLTIANSGEAALDWQIGPFVEDLLNDGGFEAGTPNPFWQEDSTNFDSPLCTEASCAGTGGGTGAFEGQWWTWFGGMNSADESAFVAQNVTVPDEGELELAFRLEIPLAGSEARFEASMDGTSLFELTEADAGPYSAYQEVSVDASVFTDGLTHYLRFDGETKAGGITNIFLDDVRLLHRRCDDPADIPWLEVDLDTGTVAPGAETPVTVSVDAAGLAEGEYEAELCVTGNDPLLPVASVPVTLSVVPQDRIFQSRFQASP